MQSNKPQYTIRQDVKVGIYDNCEYIARVYVDKIVTVSPYVKWVGNSGGYAEHKEIIRDQATVDAVLVNLQDGAEDRAWQIIHACLF